MINRLKKNRYQAELIRSTGNQLFHIFGKANISDAYFAERMNYV